MNTQLGFSHLGKKTYEHAVGLGSAYGDESLPNIKRIKLDLLRKSGEHLLKQEVLYQSPVQFEMAGRE